ncbi:EI24 domain-containing protein [Streptomyces boninensis]|uniref:EI24 domain-containing protein n=1 Tax=Streptomyces boninensis TaxID=2039455 RepID=UPI003B2168FE
MRDFRAGLSYLGKGQRWMARHGRWYGFGLLPGLVAFVLFVAALVTLGVFADDIAAWATPFADGWSETWRGVLRGLFMALLLVGGIALAVLSFTAVTLLIGEPFYEKLSEQVDASEGGAPDDQPRAGLWRELWISAKESLYVLSRALMFTIPLFFLGFIPVIGQTVIPAIGFAVSGFFLAVELTSVAMQRRGIAVRERLALLRGRKMLALGFGVPLVLLFLIPLVAVFVMPGAVAGATLLVRDVLAAREAEQRPQPAPPHPQQAGPYSLRKPDA